MFCVASKIPSDVYFVCLSARFLHHFTQEKVVLLLGVSGRCKMRFAPLINARKYTRCFPQTQKASQ
jgi:hypothetical protein